MYRILYKDTNPELTLTSWEALKNDTLLAVYNEKGGSSAALAEMNAELWLTSSIGESYLMEDNLG